MHKVMPQPSYEIRKTVLRAWIDALYQRMLGGTVTLARCVAELETFMQRLVEESDDFLPTEVDDLLKRLRLCYKEITPKYSCTLTELRRDYKALRKEVERKK